MDIVKTVVGIPQWTQSKLAFIKYKDLPWKTNVLRFSWAVWAFESYLAIRQYPNVSKTEPPVAIASHPKFKADSFPKSQLYGKDKILFSLFSLLYNQLVETAVISFDVMPWAWSVAGSLIRKFSMDESYEIAHSVAFGMVMYFVTSIPNIPLSIFQTFVLEEKHGFNKTTPRVFVTDLIKGWVVGTAIGTPFLAAFLWIIKWAGASFIPYTMTFIVVFQLVMVVIYPTFIQPLFNTLSPLAEGSLRTRIEALAGRLNFPLKHLYVIDGSKRSSHSNAYFYGLPWSKHIVLFDTLINNNPEEELEAVLAHELGHWKYSHPTKMLLVSQIHLYITLSLFPPFLTSPPLLRSFGFSREVSKNPPILIAFLLFQMVLGPLETVLKLALNGLSRRFEWEADRFACELDEKDENGNFVSFADEKAREASMAGRLKRALVALHVENLSTVWVDWMYSTYHHSHPTLLERLKAMDKYLVEREKKARKQQ
ncbi:hypothetical protein FRC02_009410 [Tulasnella sp. 418]|nr:hypothetical protein FRC02_009410 [Tulasnella sp. 418]